MSASPAFTDNTARSRYEYHIEGETVIADYRKRDSKLFIDHVEAPQILRGTGAAGKLMEGIVARAKADNLVLVPVCGYAVAWLSRHAQQSDDAAS